MKAQQEGPLHTKPGHLRNLPEDDDGRDALSGLAEVTKPNHMNPQHVLELWTRCQRASWSPDSHPFETVGLKTTSNRRLIMGEE